MKKGNKIIFVCIGLNLLFGLIEWNEYCPESFDKMVNGVKNLGRKAKGMFNKNNDKKNNEIRF